MDAGMLHLHNFLRWVVVIAGLIAVVRGIMGRDGSKPYARVPGTVFVASLHVQLILGFIIYFGISGVVAAFRADPGAAMKIPGLRVYGVEHLLGMIVAAILATIGSARARRANGDGAKNKTSSLFFGIALVVIFVSIPWPFRGDGIGRGLFPGMKAPAAETAVPPTPPVPVPTVG